MVVNTLAVMTVEISISCVVKVYHHCPFKVKEGRKRKCFPFPRRGENTEHGDAFKAWSERGQLSHLQADLVSPL